MSEIRTVGRFRILGLKSSDQAKVQRGYIGLGLIRHILFVIAGYLFLGQRQNNFINYGNGSFNYSICSLLPFETYIHLGLFSLACFSFFKGSNTLSFSMCKVGTSYLFIHSILQLAISLYYSNHFFNTQWTDYYHKSLNKMKNNSFIVIHFYDNNPILFVPIIINSILSVASIISFLTLDKTRKIIIFTQREKEQEKTNKEDGKCKTNNKDDDEELKNESIELDDENNSDQVCLLSEIEIENRKNNSNGNTSKTSKMSDLEYTNRYGFFKQNTKIAIDSPQRMFLNILYILIMCEWVWYALYCILCMLDHLQLISDENQDSSDVSLNDWIVGFTKSFTMTLHRAFISSMTYKLLYGNKWNNKLSILLCGLLILVPFILNIVYFIKQTISLLTVAKELTLILSLCLVATEIVIECGTFYCLYGLWHLVESPIDDFKQKGKTYPRVTIYVKFMIS